MASPFADPLTITSIALAAAGIGLLAQARMQSRLLRARIAAGSTTTVIDPATGLYSSQATWQCIRAEASRATRLQRSIDVWVGTAPDAAHMDRAGRELAFAMPPGATGIRVDGRRLCVVSCAGADASPTGLVDGMSWVRQRIEPGEHAATAAHRFVSSEVAGDG